MEKVIAHEGQLVFVSWNDGTAPKTMFHSISLLNLGPSHVVLTGFGFSTTDEETEMIQDEYALIGPGKSNTVLDAQIYREWHQLVRAVNEEISTLINALPEYLFTVTALTDLGDSKLSVPLVSVRTSLGIRAFSLFDGEKPSRDGGAET
jgi:hypothetical protein